MITPASRAPLPAMRAHRPSRAPAHACTTPATAGVSGVDAAQMLTTAGPYTAVVLLRVCDGFSGDDFVAEIKQAVPFWSDLSAASQLALASGSNVFVPCAALAQARDLFEQVAGPSPGIVNDYAGPMRVFATVVTRSGVTADNS